MPQQLLVIADAEKRDFYVHGVMELQPGETVEDAKAAVDTAHREAVADSPDEWHYGDVMRRLRADGHTVHSHVHLWLEE